jgi:hypothetical protein
VGRKKRTRCQTPAVEKSEAPSPGFKWFHTPTFSSIAQTQLQAGTNRLDQCMNSKQTTVRRTAEHDQTDGRASKLKVRREDQKKRILGQGVVGRVEGSGERVFVAQVRDDRDGWIRGLGLGLWVWSGLVWSLVCSCVTCKLKVAPSLLTE